MSLAQCRPRWQNCQLPKRFRDILPQPPPTVPFDVHKLPPPSVGQVVASHATPSLPSRATFRTPPNIFGLVHQYFSSTPLSHDPEEYVTMADLSSIPDSRTANEEEPDLPSPVANDSQYFPYPNRSSFQLSDWYWNRGVQKSQGEYTQLVEIIGDETFNAANEINSKLGANEYDKEDGEEWEDEDAGWKRTPVSIEVPFSRTSEIPGPRIFQAADLYHRSLVTVIREKLTNAQDNKLFHYELYKLSWNPPHLDAEVPIYGDLFMSPVFHDAHAKLQEMPREPGCDLPQVVATLMFWSDATQLTSFGNTKLWPTYMYFGNESKYCHCKLLCNLSNHVAYFEMLSDSFKDFTCGRGMSSDCTTHCHRELFHKQWNILLDDEFLDAYEHGIVIHCCNGIMHRFYPRIFTYSADYPEKVLIATVRNLGGCPLVVSSAQKLIYEKDLGVGSAAVEHLLKPHSWVPTSNAFSDCLATFGFNIFHALVVDLLHEFELGVWKMLFVHLLRILTVEDKTNASDMTRMAARNFEDLLQCSIPVFNSLLPEPHNTTALWLLFTMAHWHGLVKLQMHSDLTINIMDQVTSAVSDQFHNFKAQVCSAYNTQELCQEVEARTQYHANSLKEQVAQSAGSPKDMHCKKFHAFGDYVSMIRQYGMSDSYSSEPGELEHRSPKARYRWMDCKSFVKQLTHIERRQAHIRHIGDKIVHCPHVEIVELVTSPVAHHHIGMTQKYPVHIGTYLSSHSDDLVIKNFHFKLKEHLLQEDDHMYHHNIARFNYTTYDVCRAQDVLGVYHVNVIYIGTVRIEFLWCFSSWDTSTLNRLRFLPMDDESSFSFMDPADGRKHPDRLGVLGCVGDKDDWREYYVNRNHHQAHNVRPREGSADVQHPAENGDEEEYEEYEDDNDDEEREDNVPWVESLSSSTSVSAMSH
ncbi:hypothetical protein BDR06DRAFT_984573 [Suillus hirtellus]|nr:hypothetical protein BDR06DRAFT_984573 [Suillus hirtellus]